MSQNDKIPVLRHYQGEYLRRIALPIGGIGTGTISLGGRGDLRDWEIVNRPAKGFQPRNSFFALYTRTADKTVVTRGLEGAIPLEDYEGVFGTPIANHGIPRFRHARFEATYPFGQVILSDPDVPLEVSLQAFNPLIPGDTDASSIPVAVLRFILRNPSTEPIQAAVCGSLQNFIGSDGVEGVALGNLNQFRHQNGVQGLLMRSEKVDPEAAAWGTLALTTREPEITYRTAWADYSWGDALLDFWDDFSSDGRLENRDQNGVDAPIGSLTVSVEVPPSSSRAVTFLLTWHFPNRKAWNGRNPDSVDGGNSKLRNYYATRYMDAWDVAERTFAQLDLLESKTVAFVSAVCANNLPDTVKEAALFNLSNLRSQTVFRTADGYLFGWEGCSSTEGICFGSCTHVWNYEQAIAFLFGDLAKGMREVEFLYATRDDGGMSFRVNLPLEYATAWSIAAADGQMGCIMKLYRDWQLSADDDFLHRLWAKAKKALEFCWLPDGWDADQDGVMEGCQHNTMDVEYYGPNPQMQFWYLGALRAAEEMARYRGDTEFAIQCHALYERGSQWTDEQLFNGEYYQQEIRPIINRANIHPLLVSGLGAHDPANPVLQLGTGCLVDQLVGQYMAHVCDLGYLGSPSHIQQTLTSIMQYNFRDNLYGHFNHMRTFALDDEAALLMATYPRGERPIRPFPYYNEVMTGFEYTAAIGMLYEGQSENGLRCIEAIRARYDGKKRNPFNEAECGYHYARAMTSWGAVLALTGFHYSGVAKSMRFNDMHASGAIFWANGYVWGTCDQSKMEGGLSVTLTVIHGELALKRLTIAGIGSVETEAARTIHQGESVTFEIPVTTSVTPQ